MCFIYSKSLVPSSLVFLAQKLFFIDKMAIYMWELTQPKRTQYNGAIVDSSIDVIAHINLISSSPFCKLLNQLSQNCKPTWPESFRN